jgi:hypothetical protein
MPSSGSSGQSQGLSQLSIYSKSRRGRNSTSASDCQNGVPLGSTGELVGDQAPA